MEIVCLMGIEVPLGDENFELDNDDSFTAL